VASTNNKYGDLELLLAVEEQIEHKNPTLTVGVFSNLEEGEAAAEQRVGSNARTAWVAEQGDVGWEVLKY
jgi:hypothetical protein